MKKIEKLDKLKKIELNILIYIDMLCRKNNLIYYLAYGTLLGAVRHKGFIPWDDDIDIMMPRPDYEKLMKLMKKETGNYKWVSLETCEKDYSYPFAKIYDRRTRIVEGWRPMQEELGVYVDVFPIDGLGNKNEEVNKYAEMIGKNAKRIWYLPTAKNYGLKGKILYYIGRKNINRYLVKIAKRNSFYNSKYVGLLMYAENQMIMSREYFEGGMEGIFEEHVFYIPKEYDKFLTYWYGDYMELPRKEEQRRQHEFDAWWI